MLLELPHQFGIAVAVVKPMTHDFYAKCKFQLVNVITMVLMMLIVGVMEKLNSKGNKEITEWRLKLFSK